MGNVRVRFQQASEYLVFVRTVWGWHEVTANLSDIIYHGVARLDKSVIKHFVIEINHCNL